MKTIHPAGMGIHPAEAVTPPTIAIPAATGIEQKKKIRAMQPRDQKLHLAVVNH